MMNSIRDLKERDQERETHRFNVVRQFAYVHREAAIIQMIIIGLHLMRYIWGKNKTLNPRGVRNRTESVWT